MRWLVALAGAGLLACLSGADTSPPSTAGPSASPPASAPASAAASASPPASPPASAAGFSATGKKDACALRLEEYDAARGAASGRCGTNADCACYSDIRMDNEVHVTDKVSAARLQRLADAYRADRCPTVCVQTVAQKCRPVCRKGACTRR